MPKWRDSFPVRASHRMYENHGKLCVGCGQSNPLLIVKDGLCANCAGGHTEEAHHILSKAFRRTKEDRQAVILLSRNAHRILSDLQAGHQVPPPADSDSPSFMEAWSIELMVALVELWLVLTYLKEQREELRDLPMVLAILLGLWFLTHITGSQLNQLLENIRMKIHEYKA